MQPHPKLFTPGPVEVSEKTLAAFSRPMIGHRGEDFKDLYRDIHPQLQTLFGTKQPVFLSTSSAWGVMEGAIRNLVGNACPLLHVRRFLRQMARGGAALRKRGRSAAGGMGPAHRSARASTRARPGQFDTVTLIHNETSTGVMNPLPEICCVLAKYPEVALIVDTVSSFSGVPIDWMRSDRPHPDRLAESARACLRASLSLPLPKRPSPAPPTRRTAATTSIFSSSKNNRPMDDADHTEHRPHLRLAVQARGNFRRRPNETVRASREN